MIPEIGEIKRGVDIGYRMGNGYAKFVWHACITCGKERWVHLIKGKPTRLKCNSHTNNLRDYKGGRIKNPSGYMLIWVHPDDFFFSMARKRGYVLEHRLVMAKHLRRCLQSWEIVHHKGTKYPKGSKENRADNRIENLQLVTDDRHLQITILETKIDKLLEGQRELKVEIRLLRLQNKRLKEAGNGFWK